MVRPRRLRHGEFLNTESLIRRRDYMHPESATARGGRLTLDLLCKQVPSSQGRLSNVAVVHHGDTPVASISHEPDGKRVLMVHPDANGELEFPHQGAIQRLLPGMKVELDDNEVRDRLWMHGPEEGNMGLRFGFSVRSTGSIPDREAPLQQRSYADLEYAWHPRSQLKR